MRPCSYMRSSLCPGGGDPLFFVLWHHFTEMEKKQRVDIQTNWGKLHTAHSRRHSGDRRAQSTPLLRNTGEGCGQSGGGGEGAETGRGK